MFDIGFLELIIVSVVGLLVLGPDRLPGAIRAVSLTVGKLRRSFHGIRAEIERELKADEIRQELHNQSVLQELRKTEQDLRASLGFDDAGLGKAGFTPQADQKTDNTPTAEQPAPASSRSPAAEDAVAGSSDKNVAGVDSDTSGQHADDDASVDPSSDGARRP